MVDNTPKKRFLTDIIYVLSKLLKTNQAIIS